MKVGYIQYDVKHHWVENRQIIERHLFQMDAEVVVLPELSNCGYLFESCEALRCAAEPVPGGKSVSDMLKLSEKYNCTIIFGVAELENDKVYNTAVVIHKGCYVGKYRKIHLSDFEKRLFNCGDTNEIFEVDGVKIGVQICFDLWFPEVSREQIRKGATILCALANFGGETSYQIARMRAIENLTPLVMCNRVGNEKLPELDADFLGKSSIIDASGNRLSVGEAGCETDAVCEIEPVVQRANVICRNFGEEIGRHYMA